MLGLCGVKIFLYGVKRILCESSIIFCVLEKLLCEGKNPLVRILLSGIKIGPYGSKIALCGVNIVLCSGKIGLCGIKNALSEGKGGLFFKKSPPNAFKKVCRFRGSS